MFDKFNGKTIKSVELENIDVTKKFVVIYFTDETYMTIEIEAKGSGWDFEDVVVDIF